MKKHKRISALLLAVMMFAACLNTGTDTAFAAAKGKKISLNRSSLTLQVGKKAKVKVKYHSKKLKKKTVKWSSSNKKVAIVKKGVITAKKAGTATITAKVGKYKAKVKVKVKSKKIDDKDYLDVSAAYTHLNNFRTKPGVWAWNKDNKTKTIYNTATTTKLAPLKRDEELENAAKIRAKELVKLFDHYRPNGELCFTAYPDDFMTMGENIAYGFDTAKAVTEAWIEEDEDYDGQGHRRNMLDPSFTHVGIAGYNHKGRIYWVQCFGGK